MSCEIKPSGVKARIVGLKPWLDAAASLPNDYVYNDRNIEKAIDSQTRLFERKTQVSINQKQVWGDYDGTNPNPNNLEVIHEDRYDYYNDDAQMWFRLKLRHQPVLQVQRVRVMFGDQTVFLMPGNWQQTKLNVGLYHVVPTLGTLTVASALAGYALLELGFGSRTELPNGISIDYMIGLPTGWGLLDQWQDLVRALESYAALAVLDDISELADAGLLSVTTSGAGVSETRMYDRFEKKRKQLTDTVNDFMALLKDTETMKPMAWI